MSRTGMNIATRLRTFQPSTRWLLVDVLLGTVACLVPVVWSGTLNDRSLTVGLLLATAVLIPSESLRHFLPINLRILKRLAALARRRAEYERLLQMRRMNKIDSAFFSVALQALEEPEFDWLDYSEKQAGRLYAAKLVRQLAIFGKLIERAKSKDLPIQRQMEVSKLIREELQILRDIVFFRLDLTFEHDGFREEDNSIQKLLRKVDHRNHRLVGTLRFANTSLVDLRHELQDAIAEQMDTLYDLLDTELLELSESHQERVRDFLNRTTHTIAELRYL